MIYIVKIIVGVIMAINLKNIFIVLGFIIWIIYLFGDLGKELNTKKLVKNYKAYIKKNIFKLMRLDKLILIVVFILYTTFHNKSVNVYLFFIIMLYFLVNLFYENINFKIDYKKEWQSLGKLFIIIAIPLLFYLFTKKLTMTYFIMFGILFFFPLLFFLFNI